MQNETKLTARLVKAWSEMLCEVISIHGSGMQAPGWPDVFLVSTSWTGFIEFKGPTTATKGHQTRILRRLEGCPVPTCLVRFLRVEGELWSMQVERSDGSTIVCISVAGPDGVVAAGLLRQLREVVR